MIDARRSLDNLLLYRLSRLYSVAGSMVIRLCEGRFGITRREWRLIATLAGQGELGSSQLAEHAQLDRARTSKAVGSMVAKGLVSRTQPAGDQRHVVLRLTDQGHALYDALFPLVSEINAELMSDVMRVCGRFEAVGRAPQARISRLIESGAWTDAALVLLELELPRWKVRRLVLEDGEWLGTLSRQLQLPIGLDEAIEGTHELLPLAILIAMLDARRASSASPAESMAVPRVTRSTGHVVNCDNFA